MIILVKLVLIERRGSEMKEAYWRQRSCSVMEPCQLDSEALTLIEANKIIPRHD